LIPWLANLASGDQRRRAAHRAHPGNRPDEPGVQDPGQRLNPSLLSGCTAADENLQIVGGDDVDAQARQCLTAIGKILAAAGATFADVLKVTVYLTDINDRSLINPVRQQFFGTTRPASTLVEVSALAIPGAKVEIEAVARANGSATA
jgi:enamine deaminase RidA (YjgF/YER057c/UK114 family)